MIQQTQTKEFSVVFIINGQKTQFVLCRNISTLLLNYCVVFCLLP